MSITTDTREKLQEAVDAAHAALLLRAAGEHGLIAGRLEIDANKCEEILRQGQRFNVFPQNDERALENLQGRRKPNGSSHAL